MTKILEQILLVGILCSGIKYNVPLVHQYPNGCEVASLTELVQYSGYDIDMHTLYESEPKANWGDPNNVYINNFYCFENVIKATAIKHNIALESTDNIYLHLPCIVWGTLDWTTPKYCKNGLYRNLHCVVVRGVDLDYVYLADPLYGYKEVPREQFEAIYEIMGSRNLYIKEEVK